eukprot:Rhum_TRINITY_DN14181_c4_g1::Rhum_TRINITY_DN14181_c4_g1_i1::g.72449::m.72449/K10733/GINS2, PSF2; GINS complex subunit 2
MNREDVRAQSQGVASLEFMAQEEIVRVIPNFLMDEVDFISGRYGPFNPPDPVDVPLWLAMLLRESGRCKIVTPLWMSREHLAATLQGERDSADFQPLPFHYQEIGKCVCRWREDVKECTDVERLLLELDSMREEKIRRGIGKMRINNRGYKLTALTSMEINSARSQMGYIMDTMQRYDDHAKSLPAPPVAGDLYAVAPPLPPPPPEAVPGTPFGDGLEGGDGDGANLLDLPEGESVLETPAAAPVDAAAAAAAATVTPAAAPAAAAAAPDAA